MRPIEAVLFDMDGVLVNTNPFHRRAWHRFCREMGKRVTEQELREKVFGWRTEEGIINLWGESLDPGKVSSLAARKEEIYRGIIRGNIRPVRGLKEFVALLRQRGTAMALATSAYHENVELLLDELAITDYFSLRVLASEVGRGKPDPGVFLVAAQRLGVEAPDCLVIEDSLSGVTAARRAGMLCAALTTTHRAAELRLAGADVVCRDFAGGALKEIAGIGGSQRGREVGFTS